MQRVATIASWQFWMRKFKYFDYDGQIIDSVSKTCIQRISTKRSLTIAAAYRLDQKKHLEGRSDPVARFPLNIVRSTVATSGQFRLIGGVRPEQVCVGHLGIC